MGPGQNAVPPVPSQVLAPPDPDMVVAFLVGFSFYLADDAKILPCPADAADQVAVARVITLIQRHCLKMDV
jgi:hypothetical protein